MRLTPGTRLGAYEIIAPLGAGGMGEVHRARDSRLGRDIALKVLLPDVAGDGERLARLEREAHAVAALNHPNIVTLHSIEEVDGVRFITMELVEGRRLDESVPAGGFPLERLLDTAIALADAVAAAHARGIVHRDLKPANVMMTAEGRVKVLDFGLARLSDPDPDGQNSWERTLASPISAAGQVIGTVPYMAPEQIRGEPVDARTDLFALGILLYEMATGRRPFAGASAADVSSAILRDVPAPPSSLRRGLTGELDRIIGRCLEKSPRDRPASALELVSELRRMRRTTERSAESGADSRPPAELPSIAVLPFVNRSHDPEDAYFADGLADELLAVLAKIRGLRVAARSSSFAFRGKEVSVSEVGGRLGVATVLEGTVRKSGTRVRIGVQLVKVGDGFHLWSETYDRTLDDIFAVQDDIAQSVVKELRTTLLGEAADSKAGGEARADVQAARRGRGRDPEAHRLYLQGKYCADRLTRDDMARGLELLRQAVERDPENAVAWGELGRAWLNSAAFGFSEKSPAEARACGLEAIERALALEPDRGELYAHRAWTRMMIDWDWPGAARDYRHALELDPESAVALRGAGVLAHCQGRVDEAVALTERSLERDPLSPSSYNNLGADYLDLGRLDEAAAALHKVLELAPASHQCRSMLSFVLLRQGRLDDALAEAEQEPDAACRLEALAIIHHARVDLARSQDALERLVADHASLASCAIAHVHAERGDFDAAFAWLERARAQREDRVVESKADDGLRRLHDDPRWQPFLERIGLAD